MIACDPTEKLAQPFPGLEAETGADIIISALQMPLAPATLKHHIQAGALLIQRKSGLDLVSSIGGRLWSSLARMRATGARQWQCVLLTTGVFLPDPRDGTCLVAVPTVYPDGHVEWRYLSHPEPRQYSAVLSCLRHWCWYGGVVVQLPSDDLIPRWLEETELRLVEKVVARLKGGVVKEIWDGGEIDWPDDTGDPLQEPREVKDWRRILAAFPGVGPARATALREAMLRAGMADNLMQALVAITDPEPLSVPGWGPGLRRRVREALGLEENEIILTDFVPR